jgi:site-specific DNA-methyltransferase (adenine-specific)
MINVEELQPYAGNPRKNDKAVKAVAESIRNFGFKVPITIDKEGVIVTGHTRLRAAIKLGMKEVPVIRLDDLNDDQIKAFRLVDNKVAEIADWDVEALIKELNEIEMDLSLFGFEKQKGIDDVEDDEFKIELPKKPNAKEGDIYQLGKHRLICGDSTDPKVIEKLMDMDMADCFITDPPYNIDYEGGANAKREKIINDHLSDSEFGEFLQKAFAAAAYNMKAGAAFYIWHADKETINFRQACDQADLEVKQTLIWNKNAFTLGRQDYQWKHEPCLYGWKRGGESLLHKR